jgi:dGTP triphosphohydrolase
MASAPTQRMRELERLLAKIRNAGMVQLNYDMWEHWGAAHASPEYRATMKAGLAEASRDRDAAKTALETLVQTTRAEAPAEIVAWADAHDAYLAAFLEDCVTKGEPDSTAADLATRERAAWAEVRGGERAFVEENLHYVTDDPERYRRLFGIDLETLEDAD